MRYLWLALFPVTAMAQTPGQLAPFADASSCPGLTYQINGTNGWNYGGTNDLSDGNGQFASYQANQPTPAVSQNGSGMTVGVVQANSGLQGTMINTRGKFAQQYGYIEINAELTEGALQPGMTTAVWMMSELGGWPPEIDVLETAGNTGDTAVHSHEGDFAQSLQPNLKPGSHIWAVDWNKETITFYIDGEIPKWTNGKLATTRTPSDFHVPMHLIVDAMSHGATGTMHIRSLRVFKDMASAVNCVPQVSAQAPSAIRVSATPIPPDVPAAQSDLLREEDLLTMPPPPHSTLNGVAAQRVQAAYQRLLSEMPQEPVQPDAQTALACPIP